MTINTTNQRDRLTRLLQCSTLLRARELRGAGIASETIARAVKAGEIERVARGLYRHPDAPIDAAHTLAETAKKIPKGVIAMVSALAPGSVAVMLMVGKSTAGSAETASSR